MPQYVIEREKNRLVQNLTPGRTEANLQNAYTRRGGFTRAATVAVKSCAIDAAVRDFYRRRVRE